MTRKDYFNHYLVSGDVLKFFLLAVGITMLISIFVILITKLTSLKCDEPARAFYKYAHNYLEKLYEMIFSASSILSFLSIYYLIDRFGAGDTFIKYWDKYKDFILLIMIILSCVINSYLDKLLIPLKKLTPAEKASVRLMGMFYVLMIFAYIKYIYEDNNYDRFIIYFLGLIIGRFVYFDASFKDFLKTFSEALSNLPLLVLGLCCCGGMCLYGFQTQYLLKSNGVLVSTFIAHIYLIVAIFIIHHSHILNLLIPNPKKSKQSS